ncbi:MAG TPA: Hint domain-containing protein, partial [Micromonosporaceae bacterium]
LREPLAADQRLTVYRDHKRLNSVMLVQVDGGYQYQLGLSRSSSGEPDQTVAGEVTTAGVIQERSRTDRVGGCPICLERQTRISTPAGEVAVDEIKPGQLVWTLDWHGQRVAAPVERVVRRATSVPHLMLRLAMADGRVLIAAGAHPAFDATLLRDLRVGQRYDGSTIVSLGWVPSTSAATYDLRPAGKTGAYWANGILVGSTL